MTETQWLRATDAASLLWLVRERRQTRKLRLFACACCRRLWRLLSPAARQAVEAAELYADRLIKDVQRQQAHRKLLEVMGEEHLHASRAAAGASARSRDRGSLFWVIHHTANAVSIAARSDAESSATYEAMRDAHDAEQAAHLALVREVFGNPFRLPTFAPLLAGDDGTIGRLALAAYQERRLPDGTLDPARLAVLADAMEEAGCLDADALAHLRGPGPHVRGCWVLDLILGKE